MNHFDFMTEQDCKAVVDGALHILATTGCEVKDPGTCELFEQAGCTVDGTHVTIPEQLMREALATVPKSVDLYDRQGELALTLSATSDKQFYMAGIAAMGRIDPRDGSKHDTCYQDAVEAAIVEDNLDNIDVACACAFVLDKHEAIAEVYETRAMIEHTSKPFMMNTFRPENIPFELELLAAGQGKETYDEEKPYTIGGQCAISPLVHDADAMKNLRGLFEHNIPSYYIAAPSMAGTGPVTMAGSMVVSLADCFVGLLLSQLVHTGAPFIASCFIDSMDMRSMQFTFSSPEFCLVSAAPASIFRYLDIPYLVHLGATDSPVFDEQAAFDITAQLMAGKFCNCNGQFFLGFMESAMGSSLEAMAFGDEVIGYLDTAVKPIEVNDDTLALDLIDQVGPGGTFTAEVHTFEHCRDLWAPTSFMRCLSHADWHAQGAKTLGKRLNERVLELLEAGPRTPLPPESIALLDSIIEKAEAANA